LGCAACVGICSAGVDPDSAIAVIAAHREAHGHPIYVNDAAIELINILRPTVAVSRFITFAALALHEQRHASSRLVDDATGEYTNFFAQEVRRFYPFFPAVGGCARERFTWRDVECQVADWVLLDLYGTNHDARIWDNPDAFAPERFRHWQENAFNLVPQGGGAEYVTTHRCGSEPLTIALLTESVRLLTREMRYDVPAQDSRYSLSRMPARPQSGFVITNVRPF
jgi:fatty-acid peroxygenase